MAKHSLTDRQIDTIRDVLQPYAQGIAQVGIFGSRALGTARPNSDIDLVLYGSLSKADIDRIWTLFDESGLSITVDVCAYELIRHRALKEHIDQVMELLFYGQHLARVS